MVTLRARRSVPQLRRQLCFRALRAALVAGKTRGGFRVVQFSVMTDHMHLVVEADDKTALSRGMQGLAIRMARALNAALGRRGTVFFERFHADVLGTSRHVRNALAYVLLNERKHAAALGYGARIGWDPCSSAPHFDGWTRDCEAPSDHPAPVAPARGWLLDVGWRRHGLVDPTEIPGGRRIHGRRAAIW